MGEPLKPLQPMFSIMKLERLLHCDFACTEKTETVTLTKCQKMSHNSIRLVVLMFNSKGRLRENKCKTTNDIIRVILADKAPQDPQKIFFHSFTGWAVLLTLNKLILYMFKIGGGSNE